MNTIKGIKSTSPLAAIPVPTSAGLEIIDCPSIIRIEAIGNYSKLIFTNGKSLVVAKVLAWFEEKLADSGFTRLHRSHLINMQYIKKYCAEKNAVAVLQNNDIVSVSKRKRRSFKNAINQFYNSKSLVAIRA